MTVNWPPGWGPDSCDSFVSHERLVAAPESAVFALVTTVEDWPKWQRGTDAVELTGSGFVVTTALHTFDGIVGELVAPNRFGWAAICDGLSFYQSWLLIPDENGTRVLFQEASRGPSAVMHATSRTEQTHDWLGNIPPV
ncbi:SRPBCC family protein [Lentzea sp. NPDC006480]|uniref:SRPBCC family protein n=1 Tax=Lentzea sp. NPDC006480 TaxID=3157176 RepID=UPI0033AF209B